MNMDTLILKKGKEKSFQFRHPWIFSGALDPKSLSQTKLNDGSPVKILTFEKTFIGYGLYNSQSQIRVRLYSFREHEPIGKDFFRKRIYTVISRKKAVLNPEVYKQACRLIFSENDQLSGLTVDKFSNWLSVQITSLALWFHKDEIINALAELVQPQGIYLRTEKGIAEEEGLLIKDGLIWGIEPEHPVLIEENGIKFLVNIKTGQKTGFYNDQRENHAQAGKYAQGRSCLDLCTYTGGFALNLAKNGALSVKAVDVSQSALDNAKQNAELNKLNEIDFIKSDAFKFLENELQQNNRYDLIVLDPPKFTHSKSTATQALKGYIQLNTMAMKCLNENGILITCSCSGRISREDFQFVLLQSSLSANKTIDILERRGPASDHSYSPYCPESDYLKCFICCVHE